MLLLVGLGNPGSKYQFNRHNAGFMAIDSIANFYGFEPFSSKFQGQVSKGKINDVTCYLLKPETFMNESGRSLQKAISFYKFSLEQVVVFYDELDLPTGSFRMKKGGGLAGHNGLKSIKLHIGNEFRRARIGIGHPGYKELVTPHVLGDFSKEDDLWLTILLNKIAKYAPSLINHEDSMYQNQINQNKD